MWRSKMQVKIRITHVGPDGDRPKEVIFYDVDETTTVHMHLNKELYRIDLAELAKAIKALT